MTNGQGCAPAPLSCGAGAAAAHPFPCSAPAQGRDGGCGLERSRPWCAGGQGCHLQPARHCGPCCPHCSMHVCSCGLRCGHGFSDGKVAGCCRVPGWCAFVCKHLHALEPLSLCFNTHTHTDTRVHAHTCCFTLYADACLYMLSNAHVRIMHMLTHTLTYRTCMHVFT